MRRQLAPLALAVGVLAGQPARAADTPPPADDRPSIVRVEATSPEGAKLYLERCAACHDHASGRIPPKVLISVTRAAEDVIDALTLGVMRPQAAGLSDAQIRELAIYLTGRQPVPRASADANLCKSPASPALSAQDWRNWGRDLASSRYQPDPGFSAGQVPGLRLRWTFAYPGRAAFGQPAVVGDLVLTGGNGGRVFALDAASGCTHWSYAAGALVRTGIVVDQLAPAAAGRPARLVAWFGDDKGVLHAIDVRDGRRLWTQRLDDHPITRLVGTPQLHGGVLYAPVSSFEEVAAADPKYRCCSFRGSLVALDAATGKILWRAYTIRTPPVPIPSTHGQTLLGPAGGSVFSAPTIDAHRGRIYLGTGDAYTNVESDSTNAILALKLSDGTRLWTHQVLKNDAWILLCTGAPTGNCPSPIGPDFDFASSPMLIGTAGHEVLVAGAKSGIVYGLDPQAGGKLLWQRALAAGTPNGAILWGSATDGTRAYVATSEYDPVAFKGPGALVALAPQSGAVLWRTPTPDSPCAWGTQNCSHALLAGVAAMPGVVFAGAMDGYMRAYDARDGHVLWQFDTGGSFDAVNGVRAHGGAIDYGGQVLAHGMLFVNSGSMRQAGNLLLAFAPAD